MDLLDQYNPTAALFLVRVFLGLLFLFQGYDAVFRVKIRNIVATYQGPFASHGVPGLLSVIAIWFTSLTELVFGALLVLGLFHSIALYFLGLNLLVYSYVLFRRDRHSIGWRRQRNH